MKEIIEEIVKTEWNQFQKVQNQGGRAGCQDDWQQFYIMRCSQFLTWPEELLESYLGDLKEADASGRNLIFNKYAYMMEITDSKGYSEICHVLPQITLLQRNEMEKTVQIQVEWAEKFAEEYPDFAGKGRPIHQYEECAGWTSIETYQRGELYSYGPETRKLYCKFIELCEQENRNLTYEVRKNMARMYGYVSLEDAERSQHVR